MAPGDRADDGRRAALLTPAIGDTIFALSSGAPPAAIAVVRVSGPGARSALETLAGRVPSARRATLGALRDGTGALLDRALLLWLPGPATVTGEDMAELHLHGGRGTIAAVLSRLAEQPGLRLAGPGEFTRRALVNGRTDLARAEGLADLLAAETEGQRRAALRVADGGLGRLVDGWRTRLLRLSAQVEAAIEFAEEHEDVPAAPIGVEDALGSLGREMRSALDAPPAERLRDGLRIVIAGPVNAGKSSLLNGLAGRQAAITAPIEGTTRDLIEVPVILDGTACILIDGAGLRDTDDPVERIGVALAQAAIASADLLLWLGEPADCPDGASCVRVHAQADRPERRTMPAEADIAVSVVSGSGMAGLREMIATRAQALLPADSAIVLNVRHRALVREALQALEQARSETDELLVAESLRLSRLALDGVTGGTGVEEMLDAVFSRFCVGK